MDKTERKALRKSVKRDANKVGFPLLLYSFITLEVTVVWLIAEFVIAGLKNPAILDNAEEYNRMIDEVTARFEQSGWSMIAGVLLGLVVLFLLFLRRKTHKQIFRNSESITIGKFAGIACVFFGFQLVFQGAYLLMEMGLNAIGYTAEASMESATMDTTTFSMLLYAGIIGPIVEELVYRGFAMRALEKHGKILAIVVSSLLFGIMHANLPQAVFAFFVGLVLGYVAMKYSIVWSIVLHILNNLVLGEGMNRALSGLGEDVQNIIFYVLMSAFFVIGVIYLIVKRKTLSAYLKENKTEKPKLRWVLTCSGVVLFVLAHLVMALSMLEKI